MPAPPPPRLTPQQRMAGVARSSELRQQRARILTHIKTGQMTIQDVFDRSDQGDPAACGLLIRDLLLAVPKVGPRRADTYLHLARIRKPNRHVVGVGPVQRRHLLNLVGQLPPYMAHEKTPDGMEMLVSERFRLERDRAQARKRAAILQALNRRDITILDVLDRAGEKDPFILGMTLRHVLSVLPGIGQKRADRLLATARLNQRGLKVEDIDREQRTRLTDLLPPDLLVHRD